MSSPREQASHLLEPLIDQPLTRRVLSELSGLRDRTLRVQEATLGALNLPTAAEFARLERRFRSLTDGLARIADQLDRVEVRLRRVEASDPSAVMDGLRSEVSALRDELGKIALDQ